jgi:hypothetical protein
MNESITLNFNDYLLEIGNVFFNVNENDMKYQVDDLDYESEDKNGFNGVMLRLERGTNEIRCGFISHILIIIQYINRLFLKKKVQKAQIEENYKKQNQYETDINKTINNKVRNRLLSVINEDIDKWQLSPKNETSYQRIELRQNRSIIKIFEVIININPLYQKLMYWRDKKPQRPIKNPIREIDEN